MSSRVFGLGIGVFIITFIWIIAFLACLSLTRSQGIDGALAPTIGALVLTLILVFFPRDSPTSEESTIVDVKIVDNFFIPRISWVVLMCLIFCVSVVVFYTLHVSVPVQSRRVQDRK